jgi:LysR family transcriptional regulator (chromosome initiation inhibitor)
MHDYKLLEALATVLSEGGFDKASDKLNITQSAVSQRIKLLEDQTGLILLTRSTPPKPTEPGKILLKHHQMVSQLETDLNDKLNLRSDGTTSISVGINADSLATWFMEAITPFLKKNRITLDLYVDDQDQTHKLLKEGVVAGCVSSYKKAVQGCNTTYIGDMEYRMAATPLFKERFFKNGFSIKALKEAPAVIFNRKDDLHNRFLLKHLKEIPDYPKHYVPSSETFTDFIIGGVGYGMIPFLQSKSLFENGDLIELIPEKRENVELFWHCWNLKSSVLEEMTNSLKKACLD